MIDLVDKVAQAIALKEGYVWDKLKDEPIDWRDQYREFAHAAIVAVIKDQMEWTKTAGYNDWVRLVFRNYGLLNDIEVGE